MWCHFYRLVKQINCFTSQLDHSTWQGTCFQYETRILLDSCRDEWQNYAIHWSVRQKCVCIWWRIREACDSISKSDQKGFPSRSYQFIHVMSPNSMRTCPVVRRLWLTTLCSCFVPKTESLEPSAMCTCESTLASVRVLDLQGGGKETCWMFQISCVTHHFVLDSEDFATRTIELCQITIHTADKTVKPRRQNQHNMSITHGLTLLIIVFLLQC